MRVRAILARSMRTGGIRESVVTASRPHHGFYYNATPGDPQRGPSVTHGVTATQTPD